MISLLILLAFLLFTEPNTANPNVTKNAPSKHLLSAPAHQALPNPYPVEDSSILLDFYYESPGPPLARGLVTKILDKAGTDVLHRMDKSGNVDIPPGTHQISLQDEVFVYEVARQAERAMRYSDVLVVIRGWRIKDRYDESRHRLATVLYREADGRTVEVGEAGLLKKASVLVDDDNSVT